MGGKTTYGKRSFCVLKSWEEHKLMANGVFGAKIWGENQLKANGVFVC